jgi:hypothetical protein
MSKQSMRLFSLLILFVFVFVAATPALAAVTVSKLTVENKTTKRVDIVLTLGTSDTPVYTIYANPGRTQLDVKPGVYKYKYTACGQEFTGTLKAKSSKAKIKIAACKTSNIVIINRSSTTLFISLYGAETYNVTVPSESVYRLVVIRGDYRYTATWCGSSKNSTISAKAKSYRWMFWGC